MRAAAPLLTGIAEHLRSRPAPPRPLARIEWLLTAAASPLYGCDPGELARQLELIRRELARDTAKGDTGGHDCAADDKLACPGAYCGSKG